ncbi:MAG: gamma-glutamyltransferase [Acetobacter sp.]|uniref:gamma-glutamyltransferase n=1 Tax=Acetobacter sp. TaxID=440 RepID=UPI0039E8749D
MQYDHWRIADGYSSPVRPVISGVTGAVSAAHPLAAAAAQDMLVRGGSAVDAAIAAQAVLCVVMPDACGIGGDLFALVDDGKDTMAVSGAGAAPRRGTGCADDGANSITVPGLPGAWASMHDRWGKLPFSVILSPAIRLAAEGIAVSEAMALTVRTHAPRLKANGAASWSLLGLSAGERFVQKELAALLRLFVQQGPLCFYEGDMAASIARAVAAQDGALDEADLAAHVTEVGPALAVALGETTLFVQPPPTQGVLLGMTLRNFNRMPQAGALQFDHIGVELTEAAFAYRDRAAQDGAALLDVELEINPERASRRGGPRAYLHTAGVAVADSNGLVVSSLVSVFDDFGSCLLVPELGITLNNRAGGFTHGANAWGPGRRPVHTLAPALLRSAQGRLALATPGADGQVQTLLQLIMRMMCEGEDLATAVAAPRWRSQGGKLLIEKGHPSEAGLAALGHDVEPMTPGATCFGAVVCAGVDDSGAPFAVADWRRNTWAGVV